MDELIDLLEVEVVAHRALLPRELFGSSVPTSIADALAATVRAHLPPILGAHFVRIGVGLVIGVRLVDRRDVVIKVHRSNVDVQGLEAIQRVQSTLATAGLPAPRPLAPPTSCGTGTATVEELRRGDRADGHHPATRRSMAAGLAELITVATDHVGADAQGHLPRGPLVGHRGPDLWSEPHDLRFDFVRTSDGAEWIDDLARSARSTLAATSSGDEPRDQAAVAHLDWRVENLGFDGHRIGAIYDWDSIGVVPEAVAVGLAAAQFSTDWSGPDAGATTLPSLAEMRAFVDDYESHRGRSFEHHERLVIDAANLLLCAYGARCQHSDRALHPDLAVPIEQGWSGLLRERGRSGLLG